MLPPLYIISILSKDSAGADNVLLVGVSYAEETLEKYLVNQILYKNIYITNKTIKCSTAFKIEAINNMVTLV